MQLCIRLIACLCPIALAVARASAIINGYEPAINDRRFDAVAAFTYTQWLPPQANGNYFGSATLISPTHALIAVHLLEGSVVGEWPLGNSPPASEHYSLRFRRDPAGNLATPDNPQYYYDVAIDHFILPAPGADFNNNSADFAIAVLATPVTHIDPIQIAFNYREHAGDVPQRTDTPIIFAGWGHQGPLINSGPHDRLMLVAGLAHQPEGWRPSDNIYSLRFDNPSPPNPCGCGPATGDSGGAILVENTAWGGRLLLIGVIGTTSGGHSVYSGANAAGIPQLPQYRAALATDITGDGTLDDADYRQFLNIYRSNSGYRPGINADFDDSGSKDLRDHRAVVLHHLASGGTYCPADADGNGSLDVNDYIAFPTLYAQGDPAADIDLDGQFTAKDYTAFINAMAVSCP